VAYAIRKDKKGRNCYHIAASSGNADLLAGLLDKYQLTLETLDITDNTGKTPLELAQAGKNPQLAKLIQRRRAFLAIKADNLALFKELLTHFPADLDQPNLIAYACSDARAAILKLLLEANKGLSADEKMILLGASGKTPSSLQYAVAAGRTEIVRLLIDEEWWKEKEALVRYLDWVAGENSGASYLTPVYKSEAMLKEKPESAAVVKAVADKLIPKKEKK
jgi:ankyrin repeat protein